MSARLAVLSVSAAVVLAACGGGGGMAEDVTPAAQAAVSQPAAVEPEIIPLEDVQASQSGSVSQTIATTQITITYDRPVARGRELFGGIVAFGEIWNPGANDATKVSVSQPVMINGMALPAGTTASGPFQTPTSGRSSSAGPPMCITSRIQAKSTKSFA